MTSFSLRLSHKILLIGIVNILGLIAFGTIYLWGNAYQEASQIIAEEARKVSVMNDKLGRDLLDARRAEKDFILRRDEDSSKRHRLLSANINDDIDRLDASIKAASFTSLSDKIAPLAQGFGDYRKQFSFLEQNEVRLGLNEKLGVSGALRASVHDIEAKLTQVDNSKLAASMLMMRRHEKDFMLRRDRAYLDQFEKSATEFAKAVQASDLASAMKADIDSKLQKYRADFVAWVDGAQQSAASASAMSKAYAQMEPHIEDIAKDIERRYIAAQAQEADTIASVKRWMLITLALTILVVAGLSLTISPAVTKAIASMVQAMVRLAKGDMTVEIPGVGRQDEIGEMAGAVDVFKTNMIEAECLRGEQADNERRQAGQRKADMNRLASEFEAAVGEIVETVSSASTELEASAATLTTTAGHAQNLANNVASASEEASTNVQSVASATEELTSSVSEISRQVQSSARMASAAVDQARHTTAKVSELSKAAAKIGDVVELINTIAGQTNLLALNATIEAARAGEAGRGFAVVASEVKALAEQTAKATGEIGQQIGSIQLATDESVQAIKDISGTIEQLSEVSSTIAAAVEEQGAATQEISRNIQQAAQGTQLVSSNITEVQHGATETGSASTQVLSAAQSLSTESNRLRREVDRFLVTVRAA
ncbi:methyl-accepting chemotaxis protein (plasmid) [Bradyrhizobium sp. CCGUVB1N3]|uniref:methyl-accepting chemotaxis protein n=1 Tax=Bradyrhizobium sp. CCGUVB1N3 TaxID=2949629 RepID=UPI0020B2AEE3|nr:methyl-accepting chemotaxis protein [Bradyrhizobium sp. CCGUVB1N3]MCP3477929.1 methyl-accepting chemotaxis protein [Bradyrhizobium sp. CCGUVB1N3]